ncbi:MAG: DUF501 domain-containing protein [Candidatus Riflebacteria bacterium]|nr:DUF501 domain-containing protein [Candidatus Riflebacteria bacterium]
MPSEGGNALPTEFEELGIRLLGRPPRVPFEVMTYCLDGTPQVLKADPFLTEQGILKPFPTFLWLVCPRLKKLVSRLEASQMVSMYEKRLSEEEEFREKYLDSQRKIGTIRLEFAQRKNPELSEEVIRILRETSIAGSRDLLGVKCLHAHLAHFLAYGNNPIGEEVLRLIGPCCSNSNEPIKE